MKMKTPVLTPLHEDLMVEILLRLPVKSLLRFKCVCKSWLARISDPQFAKSHFDLASTPTHLLLKRVNDFEIESFNLDASLYDNSAVTRLQLKVPTVHTQQVWGTCRGFILLADMHNHVMSVWNPSSGTCRQVQCFKSWENQNPHSPRKKISGRFGRLIGKGIGYDESTEDYLIVLIGLNELNYWIRLLQVEIFSLKTNSSHFITVTDIEDGYDVLGSAFSTGLFLNNSLHWLVISRTKNVPVVLAFNLIDRSLSDIPLPHEVESRHVGYYLTIIGGCLSLCYESGVDWLIEIKMTKIWVMKEYKVHSSWTKSLVLPLVNYPYEFFAPICFTKGGGVLGSSHCGRLIKVNDKGELLEAHQCRPRDGRLVHYDIYRESLLSLPGDFAENDEEAAEDGEVGEDEEAVEDDEEAVWQ